MRNLRGELLRGEKRVDMTAATSQPSIEAIAQSTGIGNGDIERTAGLEYPADLPQLSRLSTRSRLLFDIRRSN
jgi:hypothetical protein